MSLSLIDIWQGPREFRSRSFRNGGQIQTATRSSVPMSSYATRGSLLPGLLPREIADVAGGVGVTHRLYHPPLTTSATLDNRSILQCTFCRGSDDRADHGLSSTLPVWGSVTTTFLLGACITTGGLGIRSSCRQLAASKSLEGRNFLDLSTGDGCDARRLFFCFIILEFDLADLD